MSFVALRKHYLHIAALCSEPLATNISLASNPIAIMSYDNRDQPKSKWTVYQAQLKIEVIDYAKANSNRRAAVQFNVPYDCVRRWVREEDRIRCTR